MYSAGILPYTIFMNNLYFLIGQENSDKTWSDFGGHSKEKDNNNSQKTAFREFMEETLNSIPLSYSKFEVSTKTLIVSKTMRSNKYYMYLYKIDSKYIDLKRFNYAFKISDSYCEKSKIMWVSEHDLFNSLDNCTKFKLRSVFKTTLANNLYIFKCVRSLNEI